MLKVKHFETEAKLGDGAFLTETQTLGFDMLGKEMADCGFDFVREKFEEYFPKIDAVLTQKDYDDLGHPSSLNLLWGEVETIKLMLKTSTTP